MDSFEINKIAGGVLGTLLFIMGLGIFSDALFAHTKMVKPGYDLPADVEGGHGAAPTVAAVAVPFPELMAKADAKKGENLSKQCAACHTFTKGEADKPTGPNLAGVVGRKMGSTGFGGYSDTMKAKGANWSYESLNAFLTNPKAFVEGTKMGFAGEKDAGKRADIIAYLKSITENAPALPN